MLLLFTQYVASCQVPPTLNPQPKTLDVKLGTLPTLEATQGQILSQSPTDATSGR